jgi:Transposase DDE domain
MDCARIASKLREQIAQFSGELSVGFPKVLRRFMTEMIYGIQARQSVRLTKISRALGERVSVKKNVERLSRQLGRYGLWRFVTLRLLKMAAKRIGEATLLILDISDLSKKYARRMEYMAKVRDGSEKEEGRGYWTLNVIGAEVGSARVVPLYGRLYSPQAPDWGSENAEITRAIAEVSAATEGRGIWVLDRGGDRGKLFDYLLDKKHRFIIRLRGDRSLESPCLQSALLTAQDCPALFVEYVAKEESDQERPLRLEVGYRRVRLPGRVELLTLVVVKGFGAEPLMLLTDLSIKRSRKSVWHVVAAYMSRWRVEETIRFLKQSYQLEDIRLRTYVRLQNMMPLVIAVAYFTSIYLGATLKLRVLARHVLRAARRVFGIPDFRLYALADGIKRFLYSQSKGLKLALPPPKPHFVQRLLFDI